MSPGPQARGTYSPVLEASSRVPGRTLFQQPQHPAPRVCLCGASGAWRGRGAGTAGQRAEGPGQVQPVFGASVREVGVAAAWGTRESSQRPEATTRPLPAPPVRAIFRPRPIPLGALNLSNTLPSLPSGELPPARPAWGNLQRVPPPGTHTRRPAAPPGSEPAPLLS